MKPRNLHAVAARARKGGPHDRPDTAPPIDRQPYTWECWASVIRDRLAAGREEYGDGSFARPEAELIDELDEEAADLAGWGYVLWQRVTGVTWADTLRRAPEYLRGTRGVSVWPPPQSADLRVTAVWLGALSHAVMLHLERVRRAHGL